jgi:hypothetical protein
VAALAAVELLALDAAEVGDAAAGANAAMIRLASMLKCIDLDAAENGHSFDDDDVRPER